MVDYGLLNAATMAVLLDQMAEAPTIIRQPPAVKLHLNLELMYE